MALTPLPTFPTVPAGPNHLDHSRKMQQAVEALHSDVGEGVDGIIPAGIWSAGTAYARMSLVTHDGASWLAQEDTVAGQEPGVHSVWQEYIGGGVDVATFDAKVDVSGTVSEAVDTRQRKFAYDARSFGVAADGTTDDTAALQAAIDAMPRTAGLPTHSLVLPPGVIRITGTVDVSLRGLVAVGQGVGNPADHPTTPGEGTTIRWDGAAGGTMFEVSDARYFSLTDVHLEGNDAAPPVGIRFLGGGSIGTNEQMFLTRVRIGAWPWSTAGTNAGRVQDGIVFSGTNANNDQFAFRDVVIDRADVDGIRIENAQSLWGLLDNVFLSRCDGAGLRTSASVTAVNLTCNRNAADVVAVSTAQVHLHGWWSENAGLPASIPDGGGRLNVYGGQVTITADSPASDHIIHAPSAYNGGGFTLQNVKVVNQAAAARAFTAVGLSATNPGVVRTSGLYASTIDWDVTAGTGEIVYDVEVAGSRRVAGRLKSGQALTVPATGSFAAGPGTSGTDQTNATIVGSGASVTGHSGVSVGEGSSAGENATAVGRGSAAGSTGTAVGRVADGTGGTNCTVVGYNSDSTGSSATSVGGGSTSAANSVALGAAASAAGIVAVAVGQNASASTTGAVAVGQGASATHSASVALGRSTATTAANQVMVGPRDVEITDDTKGLVLVSPDATRHRVTVDNSGSLVVTAL